MSVLAIPAGGAPPPPVPLLAVHSAKWAVDAVAGDSVDTTIHNRGHDSLILWNSQAPPARTVAPYLPWQDIAGTTDVAIPYMPMAVMTWPVLLLDSSADDILVIKVLLRPSTITRVWQRLTEEGFPVQEKSMGVLINSLRHFVNQKPHADYTLRDTDLEPTETDGPHAPGERVAFILLLELGMLPDMDNSMMAMAIIEYLLSSRILAQTIAAVRDSDTRYNSKSHFTRTVSKIIGILSARNSSLSATIAIKPKVSQDLLREAQVEAFAELFRDNQCPLTLISFVFTQISSSCNKRARAVDTLIKWRHDVDQHDSIRKACFQTYVQGYPDLALVVLPTTSAEAAFINTDRIRIKMLPGSSSINETTMKTLQEEISDHLGVIKTDAAAAKRMDGDAKTKAVLESISTLGLAARTAPSGGVSTTTSAPTAEPVINSEWRVWINSQPVQELNQAVRSALMSDPIPVTAIITKILRCGFPIVIQMLYTRASIPGAPGLTRITELRPRVKQALSFMITAKAARATSSTAPQAVVPQHTRLNSYRMSEKLFLILWRHSWVMLCPHTLLFEINQKMYPMSAQKFTIHKSRRWGNHTQNAAVTKYMDRFFHFEGYTNGAFHDFIDPAQDVLIKIANRDDDDALDIMEDITAVILFGLEEAQNEYKTLLKAPSPDTPFPQKGVSLLAADSAYYTDLAEIEADLESDEGKERRFRRRAEKRRQVDKAISKGGFPLMHVCACFA